MERMGKTWFSTGLSASARETAGRLRNLFEPAKRRPPVPALVLALLAALLCGNLVSCQGKGEEPGPGAGYSLSAGHYDLDHDGTLEDVSVRAGDAAEPWVLIVWKDGEKLWSEEAYAVHPGWNAIFACRTEGRDYLLRYHPTMHQGAAAYEYTVFSLDEAGEEVVLDQDSVSFFTDPGLGELDPAAVARFVEGLNGYLEGAELLMNTDEAVAYMDPGHPREELEGLWSTFPELELEEKLTLEKKLEALRDFLQERSEEEDRQEELVAEAVVRKAARQGVIRQDQGTRRCLGQIEKDGRALGAVCWENGEETTLLLGVVELETGAALGKVYAARVEHGSAQVAAFESEGEPRLLYTCNGEEQWDPRGEAGVVRLEGAELAWTWPVEGDLRVGDALAREYRDYWKGHLALMAPGGVELFTRREGAPQAGEPAWEPESWETFYRCQEMEDLPLGLMWQLREWVEEYSHFLRLASSNSETFNWPAPSAKYRIDRVYLVEETQEGTVYRVELGSDTVGMFSGERTAEIVMKDGQLLRGYFT